MSRFKYKLDPEIAARPIVFDVEYEWHKKFYGYHLEIQDDIIVEESLYELGFQNDDKMLFERKYIEQTGKISVSIGEKRFVNSRQKLLASLLADNILNNTKVLLTNHSMFNDKKISNAYSWFAEGLQIIFPNTVYPGIAKMKKQMGYADSKNIPFVAIVGGDEMAAGKVMLKNMQSGEQQLLSLDECIAALA